MMQCDNLFVQSCLHISLELSDSINADEFQSLGFTDCFVDLRNFQVRRLRLLTTIGDKAKFCEQKL